ncbi:8243_t:CDS:2 [Racocetra fulgida]|uniref:8243_t:CDS:1 n=1 Tax=Racocetra fulgida TaxID=60492 RepID=A0A9N8ZYI4_9GLOM|nr:8243_t:CDS:2 [Racocetra fulgida]
MTLAIGIGAKKRRTKAFRYGYILTTGLLEVAISSAPFSERIKTLSTTT